MYVDLNYNLHLFGLLSIVYPIQQHQRPVVQKKFFKEYLAIDDILIAFVFVSYLC